jgi:hypothetical protein
MNTHLSKPASKVLICNPPLDNDFAAGMVQGACNDEGSAAQDAARCVDKVELNL